MFKTQNFCHVASNNRNKVKAGVFVYRTTDDLATVTADGYFNDAIIDINLHDMIIHEQIDSIDPTKVKQNTLCVVQKTLTNVKTKIMDTDEVDGANTDLSNLTTTGKANISALGTYDESTDYETGSVGAAIKGKANTNLSNLTTTGKANISALGTYNESIDYEAGSVGAAIKEKAEKATTLSGYGITDAYTQAQTDTLLNNKANTSLNNLTSTGANIANWSSNVTNCITEIPQDINLELSSGILMLKSGSRCYLKTDTSVPSVNVTLNLTTTQTTDGKYFAIYDGSGLTTVLTTAYDYSTLPNTYSLPLAIVTVSGGAISSIDQIFNGFGYIGSTMFALPGVKGLIPNGRNSDGTLNNTMFKIYSIKTRQASYNTDFAHIGYSSSGDLVYNTDVGYNKDGNYLYVVSTGEKWAGCVVGICAVSGLKFSWTNIHKSFHAVDYNDSEYISNCAMPGNRYVNLTLGTSGDNYTMPADGYLCLEKVSTAQNQMIRFMCGDNIRMICLSSYQNNYLSLTMPVKKGIVVSVSYTAAGDTNKFTFTYANGVK